MILLLCLPLTAAKIDSVQMTSSLTNEHGVVVISLKGQSAQYSVYCNVDQDTCRFPIKGRPYELMESDSKLYRCHNVQLDYGITEILGPYCLGSIE